MKLLRNLRHALKTKCLPLIKPLQTGLLLITGLAGYMSARCPVSHLGTVLAVAGSLFLAISGSTILNMVYDRDIDAMMYRTSGRPIANHAMSLQQGLFIGLLLSMLGVGWALLLSPLYGGLVFAGLFLDVVVYTIWLKRCTSWSVVWGGIAGGMPVLAGRALGTGSIDPIGLLLALAILLWIPTHILTFGIKYAADYRRAGVPVFANTHGIEKSRQIVGAATTAAVTIMAVAAYLLGIRAGCLWASVGLGAVLLVSTFVSMIQPSARLNFRIFKFASLYMLGTMGLIIVGV